MIKSEIPCKAPDFSLIGDDDERYSLDDFRGRWLVLYFYPKDDTPGCTIEACSIRDSYNELLSTGAVIYGISMDTPTQHQAFRAKYNLPFVLLSDPRGETIRAYGAWGKKMFGREGILRQTYIIDPQGMVQKVYGKVTPLGHGAQVVDELKRLQSAGQ